MIHDVIYAYSQCGGGRLVTKFGLSSGESVLREIVYMIKEIIATSHWRIQLHCYICVNATMEGNTNGPMVTVIWTSRNFSTSDQLIFGSVDAEIRWNTS